MGISRHIFLTYLKQQITFLPLKLDHVASQRFLAAHSRYAKSSFSYSTQPNTDVVKQEDNGAVAPVSSEGLDKDQYVEGIKLEPETEATIKHFQQKAKRKEILRMAEEDLVGTAVGHKRTVRSMLEIREGPYGPSALRHMRFKKDDPKFNFTDQLAFIQADIDLRWDSIKRWYASIEDKDEIRLQRYNPKRNEVLGNDLAAAHFVVFRKGKAKFIGQDKWFDKYRVDEHTEENPLDLPDMQFELCTLPTSYDPRYLVEALDLSNIPIRFEGLENLKNLRYCKSLKFENCHHIEAWCMDRIASYFEERLEYLDLSGCSGLTEGALCAVARLRNLKTLVVRNLPQIKNMDVVCAILEDANPNLQIIGADYEKKLIEVQKENERLDKEARELEEATITVEPKFGPGPDPVDEAHSRSYNEDVNVASVK